MSVPNAANTAETQRELLIPRHRRDAVSQGIWRDTISGKCPNALYVTIMSKNSFEDLLAWLPPNPPEAVRLRVLTLDPSLGRAAIEAFGRNLAEHKDAPWRAVNQVRSEERRVGK